MAGGPFILCQGFGQCAQGRQHGGRGVQCQTAMRRMGGLAPGRSQQGEAGGEWEVSEGGGGEGQGSDDDVQFLG